MSFVEEEGRVKNNGSFINIKSDVVTIMYYRMSHEISRKELSLSEWLAHKM
jgi:hypothetical protein